MKFIDLHCDTLAALAGAPYSDSSIQAAPEQLRAGGAGVQCFAAYTPGAIGQAACYERMNLLFDTYDKMLRDNEDMFPVRRKADIDRAIAGSGIGALLTIEGLHPITEMAGIKAAYERGVRLMTFTWNNSNVFATGVGDSAEHGLTALGHELLEYMEAVGIIPDVSHLNDGGFADVAASAKKPFIASHSCSRELTPHRRNLTDPMLRTLADKGGVVGINFCTAFLTTEERASIDDVVRHAVHILDVAGEDALALGSDFDGIGMAPVGLEDASQMPNVTDKLIAAGFTARQCEKLYCANAARVMRELLPE